MVKSWAGRSLASTLKRRRVHSRLRRTRCDRRGPDSAQTDAPRISTSDRSTGQPYAAATASSSSPVGIVEPSRTLVLVEVGQRPLLQLLCGLLVLRGRMRSRITRHDLRHAHHEVRRVQPGLAQFVQPLGRRRDPPRPRVVGILVSGGVRRQRLIREGKRLERRRRRVARLPVFIGWCRGEAPRIHGTGYEEPQMSYRHRVRLPINWQSGSIRPWQSKQTIGAWPL